MLRGIVRHVVKSKTSSNAGRAQIGTMHPDASYVTPSFFCRLVEEVVYWNTRRLSGKT